MAARREILLPEKAAQLLTTGLSLLCYNSMFAAMFLTHITCFQYNSYVLGGNPFARGYSWAEASHAWGVWLAPLPQNVLQ